MMSRLFQRLGLEPSDRFLAARVRAHQFVLLDRTLPIIAFSNAIGAVVLAAFVARAGHPWVMMWCTTVLATVAGVMGSWFKRRSYPAPRRLGRRINTAAFVVGLWMGGLWSVGDILFYPHAPHDVQLVSSVIQGSIIAFGVMTLHMTPATMYGWLLGILPGNLAAMAMNGRPHDVGLALVLAIGSPALLRAGHRMTRVIVANVVAQETMRNQAATIQMLLTDFSETSRDWLWETDETGTLTRGAETLAERLGFPLTSFDPATVSRQVQAALQGRDFQCRTPMDALWARMDEKRPFRDEVFGFMLDGRTTWIALSGKPLVEEGGEFLGYRGVAADVTAAREASERIADLAWNDPLTGLLNRSAFKARLSEALAEGRAPALLYLDLDGFKPVNDAYGHTGGDALLIALAARLRGLLDESVMLARLGGDEFAVLAPGIADTTVASDFAERIINAVAVPVTV